MEHTTTSIEVLAKTTAENLRIKNGEFLEKYPTDDAQIDYYTELAMKVFDEFEIDGSYAKKGTRKNVSYWYYNKQTLFNLLRKHPYWNEEAKAIVFTQNECRSVNYIKAKDTLGDLIIYIKDKLADGYYFDKTIESIYYTLGDVYIRCDKDCHLSTITQEFIDTFSRKMSIDSLPKPIQRMFKVGTKITKLVHKCCTMWKQSDGTVLDVTSLADAHEEGDRYYNSFDKLYAKFADTLSELVIKKITIVSAHFCDYLLMSNGNSWSSCHYINSHNIFHESSTNSYSGCYKQGCLSYALDAPSFLLYTLPNTYNGEEYYRQQKINRMCCQYDEGIIITGKCYPNNEDEYITRYRQTLQLIFSTVEGVPNLWTFSRSTSKINGFVETAEEAAHYRDYEYEGQKPTISSCKHFPIDMDKVITIGHEAYCVHCGESLEGEEAKFLQCGDHRITPRCPICGCVIDPDDDDHIVIGDHMYCNECCFYCDHHHEHEPNDAGVNRITLTDGREITVCDDAIDRYVQCDVCGDWLLRRDSYRYDDRRMCETCYHETLEEEATNGGEGNIRIVQTDHYRVGDYVLVRETPRAYNLFGTNGDMMRDFAGRIARVTYTDHSGNCNLTVDGINDPWIWSPSCFAGKIVGDNLNDCLLGRRLEEVQ